MKLKTISIITLSVLSPALVFGLGIRVPDQDAFATARGNAFTATADNPSAIYYNPAGITQVTNFSTRSGLYGISLNSHYTPAGPGPTQDTKFDIGLVPQFYFVAPIDNTPLTLGLGVYSPYGLSLQWPNNAPFNALAEKGQVTYLDFNPVIAWKIIPTLSVAGGFSINYARAQITRSVTGSPANKFEFKGDDIAPSFNVGVLWQPCEKISLGATYRSESKMNLTGSANYEGVPVPNQSANVEFPFPQTMTGGVSYRPNTNWNVEVDVDWADWSRLKTLTLHQSVLGSSPFPFNWRSSYMLELGVTRYFDNGWRVSGGYMFSENSVPDASFNPSVPDSDRHIFSVGVGQTYKRWDWDAAYQFAWGPSRTISSAAFPSLLANGSYEFMSHAIAVSVGYHF